MNHFLVFISFFFIVSVNAQAEAEKEVKQTIERFFEGFHKQDSTIIKSTIYKEIKMQSIGKNREGVAKIRTEDFNKFLKSIVSIPKDKKFEEKLLDFSIQVDGNMANAWTKYEFWMNGQFSHCGVNSFQLFNDNGSWKIIYLVDTRRREGCKD